MGKMAENKRVTSLARSQATVLVVEDSDNCAATMEMALLEIPGISVRRALSGLEALRILSQPDPGVRAVITDLNMPQMDGFELIRHIREDGRMATVPIIVVSADTAPDTAERMAQMKVDAFFAKPFSPAQVRRKLEQLLDVTIT